MIGRSSYLVFRQSFKNSSIISIRKFGMDHKKVGKGKGTNKANECKISLDSSKVEINFVIVFERK